VLLVPKTHSVTVTSLEKIEIGGRNP
jgi:hypothetical protein